MLISGWVVLVLLATAGFAAFSTRNGAAPAPAPAAAAAAEEAFVLPEVSGGVAAFVLAESLNQRSRLLEPLQPPELAVLAGPDGLDGTPLTVADPTTTTTTSPTTTTEAPATTTTDAPAATSAEARATTTTAAPTTTTTAPAATTTTAAPPTTAAAATSSVPEQATTTIPEAATTTVAPPTTARHSGGVEAWRGLVAAYFPAARVEEALSVMQCESRGDPDARNPYSGAAGLFQFMPQTWSWASAGAGFDGASVYSPEANVAAAAWLVGDTGGWGHWSCRP